MVNTSIVIPDHGCVYLTYSMFPFIKKQKQKQKKNPQNWEADE